MVPDLRFCVDHFASNPAAMSRKMRGMLAEDQPAFLAACREVLASYADSPGYQHLLSILLSGDLLVGMLCDRSLFDLESASQLARGAFRLSPGYDSEIVARAIATDLAPEFDRMRLIEILASASSDGRLVPLFTRVLRTEDTRVRSKAALLAAARSRNRRWVKERLAEPDPRVRANTVESLWSSADPESIDCLREALRDANNRVVGNALVGLHRSGDAECIALLDQMSRHASPAHRASAAWAMGETGNPRFTGRLEEMQSDTAPAVRRNAATALDRLRARSASKEGAGVHAMVTGLRAMEDGSRALRLRVTDDSGAELDRIPHTHLIVREGSQEAITYRVRAAKPHRRLLAGFVLPFDLELGSPGLRAMEEGMESCLRAMGETDQWAVVRFTDAADRISGIDAESVRLCSDPMLLAAAVRDLPPASSASPSMADAVLRLDTAAPRLTSSWHVFLVFASEPHAPSQKTADLLVERAISRGTAVHAVACLTTVPAFVRDLCLRTGGSVYRVSEAAEAAAVFERAYRNTRARYEITYRLDRPGVSPEVRVDVASERAHGDDTFLWQWTGVDWRCEAPSSGDPGASAARPERV